MVTGWHCPSDEPTARAARHGETIGANMSRMYSAAEIAQKLGVHQMTVRGWIRDGKLPARRIGGRTVRVDESDLSTFLSTPAR